jgi:hypothetical protein
VKKEIIMYQPYPLLEVAKLQQQDLIRRAEAERLYRELQGNQPGWVQRISRGVMSAAQQVRLLVHLNPARPVILVRNSSSHNC